MVPVAEDTAAASSSPIVAEYPIVPVSERVHATSDPAQTNYAESSDYAEHVPLIIDNGSFEFRAGFASASSPSVVFDNVVSKYRDRKKNINVLLAGGDAFADAQSRGSIRSPFDGDVVCGFDVMENVLDYAFIKLGITTESVQHPILMSETLCNPAYSRSLLNELLFEAYNVPSVNYGLDCLFSAYANGIEDGLLVSSGRASTLVVPMVAGRGVLGNAKRLQWGGTQAAEFMLRLAQLKYPAFPTRVTPTQAQWMVEEFCYVADDYNTEVDAMSKPDGLAERDRIVQFPFTVAEKDEKTEEELALQAERRKQSGLRLQEQTQKLRLEKLMQKENDLQYYAQLKEWKNKERKGEYLKRLESEGFETEQELENIIKKTEAALKRARARELGADPEEEKEAPTFPLVDIPDHQLDEEGIREKRKQRLMKAGYDARMRAKAEKGEEKRRAEEEKRADEEARLNDPREWAKTTRKEYADTIARMKERKRRKAMLSDRKSLAAQQRMKNITSLASDQPTGPKKRKRGGDEDTFGADDNDWAIYREIHGAEDSEEEEEEAAQLSALESRLLEFDPDFAPSDTYASQLSRKNKLTNTFLRGYHPAWDPEDVGQAHQIHLNVERVKVPEVLWQPSIAGVDQAGVDELAAHVLRGFESNTREKLAKNIFLTGQHVLYPNFSNRLYTSIRATQPVGTTINVRRASDVRFDAWRGMARWSLERAEEFRESSISRKEYEEKGSEWFKDHRLSAAWRA